MISGFLWNQYFRARNCVRLHRNRTRKVRRLELGPGDQPLQGFESLNISWTGREDYVLDASKPLPFCDGEYDLIYASHILEHIPWYQTNSVIQEWIRILAPGGTIEIWVPDGLKICRALVDFEEQGNNYIEKDGWYRLNPTKDPAIWAAGRLFTYGDGLGSTDHPNWHRALFTPRLLHLVLTRAGLTDVRRLQSSDVRGHDHGWINLGMAGDKPSAVKTTGSGVTVARENAPAI